MKHTSCIFPLLMALLMLGSCGDEETRVPEGFDIVGAWELVYMQSPDGHVDTMDVGDYTRCKIYEADSMLYSIELVSDGNQVMVVPHEMAQYSLTDTAYIENDRVTEFQVIDDTTMTTIWEGYTEVWHKACSMTDTRRQEIINIVKTYFGHSGDAEKLTNFVLSTSERELQKTNDRFLTIILGLLLAFVLLGGYFWLTLRRKREIERQLAELQKTRSVRPAPVVSAMKEAEEDFFHSTYYQELHKRIEQGNNLTMQDWEQLELEVRAVYPDFFTALRQLSGLSTLEYRVSLLTKIRCTPTEIASVLKKEKSSISSIRGRLYHKFFDKNGGAKDWDDFILSL